jgi:HSP20 family protein
LADKPYVYKIEKGDLSMLSVRQSIEPYALLSNELNQFFEDFFDSGFQQSRPTLARQILPSEIGRRKTFPALNLWENQEGYFLEAECPGLDIENLELTITGNQLTINGERKADYEEDTTFHRQERGVGKFSRIITLPTEVDPNKIEASLKNGVLTIQLLKAEDAKPRKIEVKS